MFVHKFLCHRLYPFILNRHWWTGRHCATLCSGLETLSKSWTLQHDNCPLVSIQLTSFRKQVWAINCNNKRENAVYLLFYYVSWSFCIPNGGVFYVTQTTVIQYMLELYASAFIVRWVLRPPVTVQVRQSSVSANCSTLASCLFQTRKAHSSFQIHQIGNYAILKCLAGFVHSSWNNSSLPYLPISCVKNAISKF